MLAHDLCWSGLNGEMMDDYASPARKRAELGVFFSHVNLSAFYGGAEILERHGIVKEVDDITYATDPDRYSCCYQMQMAAKDIAPETIATNKLLLRDLAEVLWTINDIWDQGSADPYTIFQRRNCDSFNGQA